MEYAGHAGALRGSEILVASIHQHFEAHELYQWGVDEARRRSRHRHLDPRGLWTGPTVERRLAFLWPARHWGQGYMTEIAECGHRLRLRWDSSCDVSRRTSIRATSLRLRLLERLGFRARGLCPRALGSRRGEIQDSLLLGLLGSVTGVRAAWVDRLARARPIPTNDALFALPSSCCACPSRAARSRPRRLRRSSPCRLPPRSSPRPQRPRREKPEDESPEGIDPAALEADPNATDAGSTPSIPKGKLPDDAPSRGRVQRGAELDGQVRQARLGVWS